MKIATKAAALAAATMMACAPLKAQAAGCWSTQDVAAAKVRDLQTMLMVATLRCRAGGIDMSAAYNNFVSANRETISGVNLLIKAHFGRSGDAQTQYDRFTTALANSYGADATGGDSCAEAAAVSQQAAAAGSMVDLVAIADANRVDPALPGGACAVTMASAASAAPVLAPNVVLASNQR